MTVTTEHTQWLVLVEEQWYEETKGELDLTEEPDPAEVALVISLWNHARWFTSETSAAQFDSNGHEVTGEVSDKEIARRVAVALVVLHYGGPAG
jgi:hypothetical protein